MRWALGRARSDLLTLRAVDIIKSVNMVIAPRAENSDASLALTTIRPYTSINQQIIEHIYPMKRDNEATLASWDGVADKVCAGHKRGQVRGADNAGRSAHLQYERVLLEWPERTDGS